MWSTAFAGFAFGLGLIVAIGAQNAFVLRQGLLRAHVGVVVAICAVSDLVLIAVGTAGVGSVITAHPTLLTVVTVLGAAMLLGYGFLAARRAWRAGDALNLASPETENLVDTAITDTSGETGLSGAATRVVADGGRVAAVAATALALTWLNPHVYLDTVVLLGSVSATYPSPWAFAAGAGLASIVWFSALGYGARLLAPLFARPAAWRVLDAAIALVMVAIAGSLIFGLLG